MAITIELEGQDVVHVFADSEGLDLLIRDLARLRDSTESGDHAHLFTESWGGHELSEEKFLDKTSLVHHVKIHKVE
jgi:hypothetical protein